MTRRLDFKTRPSMRLYRPTDKSAFELAYLNFYRTLHSAGIRTAPILSLLAIQVFELPAFTPDWDIKINELPLTDFVKNLSRNLQ
ncbi:hypothetical protein AVEN_1494-1, partial [Araneus ventricosus]